MLVAQAPLQCWLRAAGIMPWAHLLPFVTVVHLFAPCPGLPLGTAAASGPAVGAEVTAGGAHGGMSTAGLGAGLTAGLASLGTAAASLGASGQAAAGHLGDEASKGLTDAESAAKEAAAKAGAIPVQTVRWAGYACCVQGGGGSHGLGGAHIRVCPLIIVVLLVQVSQPGLLLPRLVPPQLLVVHRVECPLLALLPV